MKKRKPRPPAHAAPLVPGTWPHFAAAVDAIPDLAATHSFLEAGLARTDAPEHPYYVAFDRYVVAALQHADVCG